MAGFLAAMEVVAVCLAVGNVFLLLQLFRKRMMLTNIPNTIKKKNPVIDI